MQKTQRKTNKIRQDIDDRLRNGNNRILSSLQRRPLFIYMD